MAFKDNYKDEIATRRYQIVDNKTGAIINPDVALKRIDTPTQAGDRLIAKDVNAIGKRLNNLETGVEKVQKATLGDTLRTFDLGLKWHDDRLFYVQELADGVYRPYVQEPKRTAKIKVDYASWADTLQGYAVINRIGVFNPSGNDWVVIPCEGKNVHFAVAINGNWEAANVRVTGIAGQFSNLLVFLDRAITGNIQINYMMFYPA